MAFLRRPLESVTWLMAGCAAVFGGLMLVDPRVIDGAPAWLKPLKFAVSTAIYSATLAWVLRYLPEWRRVAAIAGTTTATVFVIEVALIAYQAARGTTSHFNTRSAFDALIFSVMGIAIFLQTLSAILVALALWRQRFADRAMGWALRLGMTIAIAGAFVGPLMTQPTAAQRADARLTRAMPRAGSHSVGGPDGGPGLPGTGWSTEHGDLRAPHFVGLHALQALPLVALVMARRKRESTRVTAVVAAAASYCALFLILLVQALAGQPLVAPAGAIALALSAWAVATLALVVIVWRASGASLADRATLETA